MIFRSMKFLSLYIVNNFEDSEDRDLGELSKDRDISDSVKEYLQSISFTFIPLYIDTYYTFFIIIFLIFY